MRRIAVLIVAVIAGLLALIFGCSGLALLLIPRAKIDLIIGFDRLGRFGRFHLGRLSTGAVLVSLGVWLGVMGWGLGKQRRYGAVMAVVTAVVIAAFAVLSAME